MLYKTDMNVILDRSGSMSSLRNTVVEMMASSFDYLSQGSRSLRSMNVASVDNFTKLATAQSEK